MYKLKQFKNSTNFKIINIPPLKSTKNFDTLNFKN